MPMLLSNSHRIAAANSKVVKTMNRITQGDQFGSAMTTKFVGDVTCSEVIGTSTSFDAAQLFHVIYYTTVCKLLLRSM